MNRLGLLIALLICGSQAWADSMQFSRELVKEDINFGKLTITKIYDGRVRGRGNLPLWAIEFSDGDQPISRIVGTSFQDYAVSPGSSVFVGISNRGYPDTAYIVIDQSGKLLRFKRHLLDMDLYCEFSMSATREWYDSESPDIRFHDIGSPQEEVISAFSVQGCGGNRVEISIW
jgi:hypothetical protein